MIVDAHHHLWELGRRDAPWLDAPALAPIRRSYDLDDLRAHTTAAGVDHTVVVQTVPDIDETRELLVQAQDSDGLIAGVVGWVDLRDPEVGRAIEALRAGPGGQRLVGIRHQVQDEHDPQWLLRADVLRGLHEVAAADLAFDLLVLPHQLPAAVQAVAEVPGGRFVLDHAAKPGVAAGILQPWASDLRDLAAHPHVACKLSGLVTEAAWDAWTLEDLQPYAHTVLDAFGPARLMAGSDWPVCELAGDYGEVWEATTRLVAPRHHQAVLGDTARRWYRLQP